MAKTKRCGCNVIVIGAGIVGASTALWLRRYGYNVMLIDRGQPGMGASYGNAGLLACTAIAPVTAPGLARKGIGYLFDPDFPLFMRWAYLPKLLPWLVRYLGYANDRDTRYIVDGLTNIVSDSVEQHIALAHGTPAFKWVVQSEYNYVYENRAAFDAEAYTWNLRRAAGFDPEIIEGPAVQEKEPILGPKAGLLAVNKDHGYILNPAAYVQDLVRALQDLGGKFIQASVYDFVLEGDAIIGVDTDRGRFECDYAVLSAGVWSKPLMSRLGLSILLEAERGYHIMYKSPTQVPQSPLMLSSAKFAATPMANGLRCAGIVEYGGLSPTKSKAPLNLLRKKVQEMFPSMNATEQEEWVGFRPSTVDSLPLIGQIRTSNIYTAFGHQHIGLTSGPKTGRIIADLIAKRTSNIDLNPYDPMRFKK